MFQRSNLLRGDTVMCGAYQSEGVSSGKHRGQDKLVFSLKVCFVLNGERGLAWRFDFTFGVGTG